MSYSPSKYIRVKNSKHPKSNKVEMQRRVFTVYNLLLNSRSRPEIMEYAREKWGVNNHATVDELIARAREWIVRSYNETIKSGITEWVDIRKKLLAKTLANNEHQIALEVLKDLNKLLGTYPSEKFDHNLTGKIETENKIDFSKVTTKQLLEIAEFSERIKKK